MPEEKQEKSLEEELIKLGENKYDPILSQLESNILANEKELDRLYHEKDEMTIDQKLRYIKLLLDSAMINEENRAARAKQALWIIYKYRSSDDLSDEVKSKMANYKAIAHYILHPNDDSLIEAGKKFLREGERGKALYHFNLLIARNPDALKNPEAYKISQQLKKPE